MKQLGTDAFTGKYIQGASIKASTTRQKAKPEGVSHNEHVFELDIGLFTIRQLSESSGVSHGTITQRLNRGWRKYEMITQPANNPKKLTDAQKAFWANKRRSDSNDMTVAIERREYYKRLAEGHPKI